MAFSLIVKIIGAGGKLSTDLDEKNFFLDRRVIRDRMIIRQVLHGISLVPVEQERTHNGGI